MADEQVRAEDFDIGDEVAIKLEVQKTVDNESEDSKGDGKKSAKKSKNTTEWVEVTKMADSRKRICCRN